MSRQQPTPVRQTSILAFASQKRAESGSTSPTSKAKMQDAGIAAEVSPQRRKRLLEEGGPARKRIRVLFESDDEVESPSRTDSVYSESTPSGTDIDPSTSGASDWTASMGSQSPPHSASTTSGAGSHTAAGSVDDLQLSSLTFDPAAGGLFSHPPISLSEAEHDQTSVLDGFLATLRAKSAVYSDSRYFREYLDAWTGYHRSFAFPSWLDPRQLRDAAGHPPTEASFAVESIRIPADFKSEKTHSTPAMVQYWNIKAANFDKVVLFKIGKFYEIFYQDACIAHKYFDLKWMGSDGRPHVGFPEVCLNAKARDFVEAGFRVAVVEQLERPQELRERQEATSTKEKAVQRGLCEVLSPGVMLHAEQIPAAARLVCFAYTVSDRVTFLSLDVASLTASFQSVATGDPLECVLDYVFRKAPVEVVLDRKTATPSLAKAFARHPVNPVVSYVHSFNLWPSTEAFLASMRELRPDADVWGGFISEAPDLLAVLTGAYVFLKEALLEKQVMTFMTLAPDLETDRVLNLTGAALDQLQVSGESSLIGLVDRCATRFGSRLLRRWVLAPLQQAKDIQSRQDAVAYLVDNLVVVRDITAVFRRTPDLERVTAALWRQSLRSSRGAVYYTSLPDKLTAQAQRLVRGYVLVADAMECLRHSPLSHIMGADYNAAVEQLRDVDSWVNSRVEVACLDGARSSVGHTVKESLIPRAGISAEFDAATARIRRLHHQLEECRVEAQAKWKINAKFVHRKFWFELECADIPNAVRREVTLTSETRNALRFRTSEIEELVRELQAAYQEQVDSLHPFNQELLTGLYGHRLAFEAFTALAAQVDCLMSLAKLSADASLGAWCRPQFVPASSHGAVFDARDSWHPLVCSTVPHFVSNDILLNVDEQPAGSMIITGPNIGGKSTVLRQACCLVILAQIGGFVPARSFALTPVDRIYTRLGVRDSILEGKSTFVVELQEALEMVRGAGTRSLCVLDEFGRGTSTCDGAAMAGAVLRRLSSSCRCLFATHFHPVSKLCETWSRCSNYRMASTVDADELRFLYKLEKGRSPQSFGIEVARSCGLPDAVVQTANDVTQTT